jgi:hypothetical protein
MNGGVDGYQFYADTKGGKALGNFDERIPYSKFT